MLDISQRWKKVDEVKGSTNVKLRCGSDAIYRLIRKDSNQKLCHFFGDYFFQKIRKKIFTESLTEFLTSYLNFFVVHYYVKIFIFSLETAID